MQGHRIPRLTLQCPSSNLNTFLTEEVVLWDLVPWLLVAGQSSQQEDPLYTLLLLSHAAEWHLPHLGYVSPRIKHGQGLCIAHSADNGKTRTGRTSAHAPRAAPPAGPLLRDWEASPRGLMGVVVAGPEDSLSQRAPRRRRRRRRECGCGPLAAALPCRPRAAAAMGSLLSRRIAGVEDIDIQANSAYRYPPKSGEGRGCG